MHICIPTLDNKGLDSTIASHFGQAAGFTIVNDETNEIRVIQGSGRHHGGGMAPGEIISQEDVDVVLCGGLGVKAVRLFEQKGIHVYCEASGTVADALKAFKAGTLPEATDANACQEHRH